MEGGDGKLEVKKKKKKKKKSCFLQRTHQITCFFILYIYIINYIIHIIIYIYNQNSWYLVIYIYKYIYVCI